MRRFVICSFASRVLQRDGFVRQNLVPHLTLKSPHYTLTVSGLPPEINQRHVTMKQFDI